MKGSITMKSILILLSLSFVSCNGIVDKMAFFPDTKSLIEKSDLPKYIRKVEIPTSDNLKISGLLFSKDNNNTSKKLVLYFHGNAGNMYYRIDESKHFFDMGYDVLIVSYRGYADSQGKPTEKGIYIDGESALNYSITTLGYTIGNIIIYGRSIGTTVAVEISQRKHISKIILITPLSSGIDFARSKGLGSFVILVGDPFNSLKKINNISVPLLVVHGNHDSVVPFQNGMKLFNEYQNQKTFIEIKNGDHNDLEFINPVLFWGSIKQFLNA
jgi:fermentation-respiration switch protein FrsA (DUF1100 family)